jgi:predicted transcriptional regulator
MVGEPLCVRSIRFPPQLHEQIMQIAKEHDRTFHWMAIHLMEERVKMYQEEKRKQSSVE